MIRSTLLRRRFVLWLSLFVSLTASVGAADSFLVPPGSDLAPDPALRSGRLPNGFGWIARPNAEPPGRVSLRLVVQSGSLQEDENQRGLAHFLEHMAFNGTRHFAAEEMVVYFQRLGMAFGADTNAFTSFSQTVYELDLPRTEAGLWEDALRLLRDYCDGMLLQPAEVDKERGVILAEKRQRDSVEYRSFEAEISFLLPQHRLPARLPIGQAEVIEKAPPERLVDYYRRWYRPDRMTLVAVGQVDPDAFSKSVAAHFGDLVSTDPLPAPPDMGEIPTRGLRAAIHRDPEASATAVNIQTALPALQEPDSAKRRTDRLRLEASLYILNRRLEILARTADSPFSRAHAYSEEWENAVRLSGLEASGEPGRWADSLRILEHELRRSLQFGFNPAELDEARASLLQEFQRAVEEAPSRLSRDLSGAVAASLADKRVFTAPETDLELARQALATLTPESTLEAWQSIWPDTQRAIFLNGNLPAQEPVLADVYRVFAESMLEPLAAPATSASKEFAYSHWGEPVAPSTSNSIPDLGLEQWSYPNGVVVLAKRTDFEKASIRVGVRFGEGLLDPPAAHGLPWFTESTFLDGGLEAHSADDLTRLLAGRTVDTQFSVEEDCFILSGRTSPQDLLLLLQLLRAYLSAPGYREEAGRLAQANYLKLDRKLRHTPQGVMATTVARALASGDWRFGFPTADEVKAVGMTDVQKWLAGPLATGVLTVAVVGDFDLAALRAALDATFGNLPQRQTTSPPRDRERSVFFPKDQPPLALSVETEIPKALVALYWPTTDMRDIRLARRLNVLASVLDDRLRVEIRERLGQAYSPSVYHRPSQVFASYGYLTAMVILDPEQASAMVGVVQKLADQLAAQGVDADACQRAVRPMVSALQEWLRDNHYWLNNVLLPARDNPARLDWARSLPTDFPSITPEELTTLAARFLPAARAWSVQITPTPPPPPTPPKPAAP